MSQEDPILHAIKYRRSIFPASYLEREIPKKLIIELLDYANYAPNHKLTQPWRFTVFKGEGLLKLANKMAELYKAQTPAEQFLQKKYDVTKQKIMQAGAIITIQVHYSGAVPRWEELAAVGCAVQNLWLAAKAYNIGAYWSTPGTIKGLHEFLEMNEEYEECLGLFYLGYHSEKESAGTRRSVHESISWVEG